MRREFDHVCVQRATGDPYFYARLRPKNSRELLQLVQWFYASMLTCVPDRVLQAVAQLCLHVAAKLAAKPST
jgi:hypothetical protein